ncbi:MAG: hypothetical protein IJD43_06895 [Thermoguttaceae bacterium]|nr:hypothetical protein [Planctomycetaceae bacterium]MBQ4143187.1 hypothetical protein [Thermoguttaceae bacterium]
MKTFRLTPARTYPALLSFAAVLAVGSVLAFSTGCRSGDPFRRQPKPLPVSEWAIPGAASAAEIVSIVNQNVMRVDSFVTQDATLNGKGIFNLKGEIAFKRPGYFRLIGTHAVSGRELDVGRNAHVMWMWVGKAEPKATYFCTNANYQQCQEKLDLSFNPAWIIEAMGFGALDPTASYEGPFPAEDQRHLELRVTERSADGVPRTRCVIVNREYGMPAAVLIYDQFQSLVAEARVTAYRKDEATGLMIPKGVSINCPKEANGEGMQFAIQYGNPMLNQLSADNQHLWAMPNYAGYPSVDMAAK